MPKLDPDLREVLEALRRGFGDVEVLAVASHAPATVQYVQGGLVSDVDNQDADAETPAGGGTAA